MNKRIIFGVSAIVILGLGAGAVFSPQMTQWLDARAKAKADQARYDTALKKVTSYIDSIAGKSSAATSWHLTVADPRTAPLAQWDKPGDKPQIMTQIYVEEKKNKRVYIP